MKRRKCENKICRNLSRRFENKFCSILCADVHDGIISELEWFLINPAASWELAQLAKLTNSKYSREIHLREVHRILKDEGYY